LNQLTVQDGYPLPRIDELLDRLAGCTYFGHGDMISGYWHCPVEEASKSKTAFTTPCGLFEFNVMPFGVTNAPAHFQRMMQWILRGLFERGIFVYLDDIMWASRDWNEHMDKLDEILRRLTTYGLVLKIEKCTFANTEADILGFLVSKNGIRVDPGRIKAIQALPLPSTVRELASFLGALSYCRRFIKNYSQCNHPLRKLFKSHGRGPTGKKDWDNPIQWTPETIECFNALKATISEPPILQSPRYDRPFVISVDASRIGICAMLGQVDELNRPDVIAYASRVTTPAESNYGVTDLECVGVDWALTKFRC
jgi:hypothetical protein